MATIGICARQMAMVLKKPLVHQQKPDAGCIELIGQFG
jgi:hypothetical protein